MKAFSSKIVFLLCLLMRSIPTLSERQVVPSWIVELHYEYLIETEAGVLKRETMYKVEELILESIFLHMSIGKGVYEMDSLPIDTIRNSGDGICTSQNETNDCFIIDGAMTIKVHGQTAHDASSSFYEVVEKTLNDQLTFSSILPESSIVFYISSTEEKNTIRRDDKRPATNITVLVTFVVGGCVFVTIALWVLCWTEERPKKISKTRKSSGGRLGISAASSPYWLERNSTSSSLSFESTVLPSNVIGSISPCSSSISDLSSHQTCDSLESNRSTLSTKLETIKEVEDKNAIDYPFNQSLFNNEYLSFRGEI